MLNTEKSNTQLKAERQFTKDLLYEAFLGQRDLSESYDFLNQLCQASVHALVIEESPLSPYAVEFLLDVKETIMTIAIMTGENTGITPFAHNKILTRFIENMKQIEKDQKQ